MCVCCCNHLQSFQRLCCWLPGDGMVSAREDEEQKMQRSRKSWIRSTKVRRAKKRRRFKRDCHRRSAQAWRRPRPARPSSSGLKGFTPSENPFIIWCFPPDDSIATVSQQGDARPSGKLAAADRAFILKGGAQASAGDPSP